MAACVYEVAAEGSLVVRHPMAGWAEAFRARRSGESWKGGVRGRVLRLSKSARRRMINTVAGLKRSAIGSALFVTATYDDSAAESQKLARDRKVFGQWLQYHYPGAVAVWKLEYARRKSGLLVGKVVGHFHALVFGVVDLDLGKCCEAWHRIVGSQSVAHLVSGFDVQRVKSARQAGMYISKYVSKGEEVVAAGHQGRFWGVIGDLRPFASERVFMAMGESLAVGVRRLLDRWRKASSGRKFRRASERGVSQRWLLDGAAAVGMLQRMAGAQLMPAGP